MSKEHSVSRPYQVQPFGVSTDRLSSETMYNGELKVIFSAVDFPAIANRCRLPARIAVYVCARAGRTAHFELLRAGTKPGAVRVPLDHPPTLCLALLAVSTAGRRELEALRQGWAGGGEGFLPSPLLIDGADGAEAASLAAYHSLLDAAVNTAAASAARLLVLQRQYTAFRIVHEALQNAFDTVENFLARSQLPPTWLAFACEPSDASIEPLNGNAPFQLTQVLPIPSQGLAALELHATPADPDAEGVLMVNVATCEDRRTLGEWAIPYGMVPDGWMFLDFPEIDPTPKQSVTLTAIWQTRAGSPPKLSLTQLQLVPENRVQIVGDEASRRSLALRLHIGLPGSRRVAHPFHIGVMPQPHVSGLGRRLAPSVLRRFAEIDAAPDREPLVRFLEDSAAIEVRPTNGGMTVAKLPGALPPKARRLSATIRTEDSAGPLVEYALLALDPRGSYKPILTEGLLNGQPGGFSGWRPIHPDFATQIHLTVAEPVIKPLDLYLATRLVEGEAAEFAQARWLEFVVDAFRETVTA
jgi:hypothetical protein